MIKQGEGDIIVTSSLAGRSAIKHEPVYSASKFAITCFTQTTRRQVNKHGIRVSQVSPGPVISALLDDWPVEKLEAAKQAEATATARLATAEESLRDIKQDFVHYKRESDIAALADRIVSHAAHTATMNKAAMKFEKNAAQLRTTSETEQALNPATKFEPRVFFDITKFLNKKIYPSSYFQFLFIFSLIYWNTK